MIKIFLLKIRLYKTRLLLLIYIDRFNFQLEEQIKLNKK
jgi:hypothetical protein